ncbi:MAG: DUF1501 domain-containing protein [Pirellulales bacterium]
MLSLGSSQSRTCGGVSRRAALQVGGLSLLGLSLPRVLQAEAAQPSATRKPLNVILLWMGGGPSNIDTFDMKPNAPVEIRGDFSPIESNVAGTPVCEHLPLMARQMDKVCLLKSVTHSESGDHVAAVHYMLTGYPQRPDPSGQPPGALIYPAYGSVVSREQGWQNSLPPYMIISGKAAPYTGAGYMGSAYSPLTIKGDPNDPKFSVLDVTIPDAVGADRTARRRNMLAALDRWQKQQDKTVAAIGERNQFYNQAYDLITSPSAKRAFKLDEEDEATRDRYGRTRNGQAALLARRLIEAGTRFVSVETHWWDTHQDNFKTLKTSRLPDLDQWWSALLEDLQQRGLFENTLVAWLGEFGRTPRVNGQAGRDHWGYANAICLSGAGIKMGTTFGETDRNCERPVGTSHTTHDFAATIYKLLGIDCTKEYLTPDGRPVLINYHGTPISQVLV